MKSVEFVGSKIRVFEFECANCGSGKGDASLLRPMNNR